MEIFNSVIVPYRSRPGSLRFFLKFFNIAASKTEKGEHQLIISDLGSGVEARNMVEKYCAGHDVTVTGSGYRNIFNRHKAIHIGVSRAKGRYITVLDVDALVPPCFLISIKEFYRGIQAKNTKLSYRLGYIEGETREKLDKEFDSVDDIWIKDNLTEKAGELRLTRERYMINDEPVTLDDLDEKSAAAPETYSGYALGTANFTMLKKDLEDLGGFDERFLGYGCEDLDFNLRAFRYTGKGCIRTEEEHMLFNLDFREENPWNREYFRKRNEKIYRENIDNGTVCLSPKGDPSDMSLKWQMLDRMNVLRVKYGFHIRRLVVKAFPRLEKAYVAREKGMVSLFAALKGKKVLVTGSGPSVEELEGVPDDVLIFACNNSLKKLQEIGLEKNIFLYVTSKTNLDRDPGIKDMLRVMKCRYFIADRTRGVLRLNGVDPSCDEYLEDACQDNSLLDILVSPHNGRDISGTSLPWTSTGVKTLQYALFFGAQEVYLSGIDADMSGYSQEDGKTNEHHEIDNRVLEILSARYGNVHVCSSTSPAGKYFGYKTLQTDKPVTRAKKEGIRG